MPRIFITLGVLILSVVFLGKGLLGIKNRSITIGWMDVEPEKHKGNSAVYWGIIFTAMGVIFLISYILIQTDFFWTQKLDLSRLF